MCVRRPVDWRVFPITVGCVTLTWATIPLRDLADESKFARVLGATQFELVWVAIMMVIGAGLIVGGIFKFRRVLLGSEQLAVIMYVALWFIFREAGAATPVVDSLLFFAAGCLYSLWREIALGARVRCSEIKPGKERIGLSDLLGLG